MKVITRKTYLRDQQPYFEVTVILDGTPEDIKRTADLLGLNDFIVYKSQSQTPSKKRTYGSRTVGTIDVGH
jgi:hypothetical protein